MSARSMTQLGKNSLFYTLGGLIQRGVGFLLLPIYTRYLTSADYGVMQLLDITVDIAAILFISGMTAGLQKYYFAASTDEERKQVVSTAFLLELGLASIAATVLFVAAPLAWYVGLREPQHVLLVRVAAVNFLLSVLSSVPLLLLQTERRVGHFFAVTMLRLGLQVSLNLIFLIYFKLGVAGILYAGFFVNLLLGAVLLVWFVREVGIRFSRPAMRLLRSFGIPYQISTVGSFVLVFGDRFFLGHSRTVGEVGLYGLAYQFGFLLSSIVEVPFIRAWNPERFEQTALPVDKRDELYNNGLNLLSVALSAIATGIVLFATPVIRFATTPEFHPAAALVPLIIIAYVIQCFTTVVSFGIDASAKTKYVTYSTWICVVVVVALYMLLIPAYGGVGAAWATIVAFAVRFALMYRFSNALFPVRYRWASSLRSVAVGTIVCTANLLFVPEALVSQFILSGILMLACLAGIWLLALHPSDRRAAYAAVRQLLGRSSDAAGQVS